jgi:hypothetical protein
MVKFSRCVCFIDEMGENERRGAILHQARAYRARSGRKQTTLVKHKAPAIFVESVNFGR